MLEIDIQQALRKRLYYTAPAVHLVAVPNAARRTQWEARRAKKEGMAPGFPDLVAIWPGGGIAFLELKTATGTVRASQAEWIERLSEYGHSAGVCRSVDAAVDFLRACGAPIREQAA